MHTSEDYWLSREEVAGRIKLPVKTLAQWATQGKGPRFTKIGRYCRYKMTDLIDWENAQMTGGSDAA